jgi:hypothetical protein
MWRVKINAYGRSGGENLNEGVHLEDLGVDGVIILTF